MSKASTDMAMMRKKMIEAVDKMSAEDIRAMVLRSLSMATTYEMTEMASATSFNDFETMDWDLDLTD